MIAAAWDVHASTVSRELGATRDRQGGYRASTAHALAYQRAVAAEAGEAGHATWYCVARWRRIWRRSTPRSRSRAG